MRSGGVRVLAAAVAILAVVGLAIWLNSGYARVSELSYDYALALVSACSRHDEATVQRIAKEVGEQDLPDYDRRVILDITELALGGDWKAASQDARELLKAQTQPAE